MVKKRLEEKLENQRQDVLGRDMWMDMQKYKI